MRYLIAALTVLVACAPRVHAQEPLGTASNAATVLRRAFELMPEVTDGEHSLLEEADPSDEAQAALLRRMEPSLQLLHQAADMPECYWELPFRDEGFNTPMPHLTQVRSLTRMADAHAQAQFPANPGAFLQDELSALAAARHTGRDGPLVSLLFEYAIERDVTDSLARHLPDLPEDALAALAAEWSRIPGGGDLRAAILMEKALGIDLLIKKVRKASEVAHAEAQRARDTGGSGTSSLADELRMSAIVDIDGRPIRIGLETRNGDSFFLRLGQKSHGIELVSADYAREEAVLVKGDEAALVKLRSREILPLDLRVTDEILADALGADVAEELLKAAGDAEVSLPAMLHQTGTDFERVAEALERPADEFQQWYREFAGNIQNLNPLSRMLLPPLGNAWEREQATQIRRQMLMTAIEVMRRGPKAVEQSTDPSGTGPFIYQETDHGFELVSDLTVGGQPVTLNVGNPPRE